MAGSQAYNSHKLTITLTCTNARMEKREVELKLQLSTARAEEREALKKIVNVWLEAYPEDIFIPPTKDQIQIAQKALQAVGMSVDKFSGAMGRHMAKRLLEQIDEAATIRNLK